MLIGTILVPLDGSPLADGVLPSVERLLVREPGTVVHLLRVNGGPDLARTTNTPEVEKVSAAEHLRASKARLAELGAKVETHLVHGGDPAAEVLAAASRLKVDLIALASHGRSGVLRWVRGSVAEAVLREATTPVLLVSAHSMGKGAPARFRRILVPLDGTERSAAVLPYVIALAQDAEAEVLLLRVEWAGVERPLLASLLSPEKVAESLRPWSQRVTSAGLRVRVLTAVGDAAGQILDVADREQADLVAMATHGRSGMTRFIDGSVAEKVLRHCLHPLLVVRAPSPEY